MENQNARPDPASLGHFASAASNSPSKCWMNLWGYDSVVDKVSYIRSSCWAGGSCYDIERLILTVFLFIVVFRKSPQFRFRIALCVCIESEPAISLPEGTPLFIISRLGCHRSTTPDARAGPSDRFLAWFISGALASTGLCKSGMSCRCGSARVVKKNQNVIDVMNIV